jgi:hypothetical protein
MAFAFGGAGALLKAIIPTFPGLTARRSIAAAGRRLARRDRAAGVAARAPVPIASLSAEAEAALAPLGLPPDGPIDPNATQRARLTPDVAARNFVRWAQALDLDGDYATRSVYALYCEFSEVDGRPPLRDSRFLDALAQTKGIATVARGKDKTRRLWRWTIEPAKPIETVAEAICADVWTHLSAPAADRAAKTAAAVPNPDSVPNAPAPAAPAARSAEVAAPARRPEAAAPAQAHAAKVAAPASGRPAKATAPAATSPARAAEACHPEPPLAAQQAPVAAGSSASAIAAANATAPAKPARSAIVLPRFVADTEHPFSPAGLRERQKSARRLRLNAAASRKQRGAVRRAA